MVAKHADIWHGFGDADTLKRKLDLIDTYARSYDRDPGEITRSTNAAIYVGEPTEAQLQRAAGGRRPANLISGTPDAIEAKLRELTAMGIGYIILSSPMGVDLENWRRVSEQIIPRFA